MSAKLALSHRVPIAAISAAFLLRIILSFTGFTRLPLVSNSDEMYWADPAMSVAEGIGYRSPTLSNGTTRFDEVYTHHPPVYIILLAGTFRIYGLTPTSLRFWPILADSVLLGVTLSGMYVLYRKGILTVSAWLVVSSLNIANFSSFSLARWGRPDPLAAVLATGAFLILLVVINRDHRRFWPILAGSCLLGLSLATHPETISLYLLYVLAIIWLRKHLNVGAIGILLVTIIPFVLLVGIWVLTYGASTLRAFQEFRLIASYQSGAGLGWTRWLRELTARDGRAFMQSGGTTVIIIYLAWALVIGRVAYLSRTQHGITQAMKFAFVAICVQLAVIQLLTGIGITRLYTLWPICLFSLAIVLSGFHDKRVKRLATTFVAILVVAEASQMIAYMFKLEQEWAMRAPGRLDPLADQLIGSANVAVAPPLWYSCRQRGAAFQVIDFGFGPAREFWMTHANQLMDFDVVVLPEDHPLLNMKPLEGCPARIFRDLGTVYNIVDIRGSRPD